MPPPVLGNNPQLPPDKEVAALRAAAKMGGTVDVLQIQSISAQLYLLNEWMRYLSDIDWAAAVNANTLRNVPVPIGGGGGAAPPPPPSWPP